MRTVFLDRDGTINRGAAEGDYIRAPSEVELLPGAAEAIRLLNELPAKVVVVTNQRGIALGLMSEDDLAAVNARLEGLLAAEGAKLDAILHCPHEKGECECRKPGPGMFERAVREIPGLSLDGAAMIGDSAIDVEAGNRLGMTTVRLGESGPGDPSADRDLPDLLAAARWLADAGPARKYDGPPVDPDEEIRDRRAHGYEGSRPDVQLLVPRGAVNILELGCSNGALGGTLKQRQPARVLGVEISDVYARTAAERLDRVVVADAEAFLDQAPPPEAPFDCLIAADVLEHLSDPWEALRRAVALLSPGATVVVSVPNVFYWRALRQALGSRRWPREDEGIFDRTHLRWFGPADARELLSGAGLEAVEVHPVYWTDGWRLSLVEALARTPAADFLPAQLLVTGRAPA